MTGGSERERFTREWVRICGRGVAEVAWHWRCRECPWWMPITDDDECGTPDMFAADPGEQHPEAECAAYRSDPRLWAAEVERRLA